MTNFEPVFALGKVIGHIKGDTFVQYFDNDHIFNLYNGKGLDKGAYLNIRNKAIYWRIIHRKTKQELLMPLCKVKLVATERDMGKDGVQLIVPLAEFNMKRPAMQKPMI